jgi:hypothetical protein
MNRKWISIFIVLLLAALVLSACFPGLYPSGLSSADQAATQNAIILQAVQATATTMAMQTQISHLQTQVAQSGGQQPTSTLPGTAVASGEVTATLEPSATWTVTPLPSSTPLPTETPIPPTNTPIIPTPTRTATPLPCNSARFVSDVTIPDGTVLAPGTVFTKTWRLKNIGACTWTTGYDAVFVGGTQMSSSAEIAMPGNVTPNQVIDISVRMTAPSKEGHYRSNWKLRDASGVLFGVGGTDITFFADIKVTDVVSDSELDFIASMCQATWSSGAGILDCPGKNNDAQGFVYRIDNPTLESGYIDDEPVLLMNPQMVTNGYIRGKYPAIRVLSGYHFASIVGCAYKATNCYVTFRLDYQIGTGSVKTLKTVYEKYDKKFTYFDVDLSALAGKDVKFILTVLATGSPSQDRAQWLAPHIYKK